MPKAFPKEFREDVIRVYKGSDTSVAQVAKDFGVSPSCLNVCAIKDVYSNRIVGYSIDSRMQSRLAVAALNHAVARRGLHTDRGSQGGFNRS